MAAALTIKRSPGQLGDDLHRLVDADWTAVWAGPDGDDPRGWAHRIGWELTSIGPDLDLTVSAAGASVTLFREPGAQRINEALQVLWKRRAATSSDNAAVMTDALDAWPGYLAAAQTVLGPAIEDGQAGRVRSAVWPRPDIGVVVTLWINLAVGTADGSRPGSASLRLAFTPYRDGR
ncbi:hypothetical protein [Actinoplanes xinjiangensis]|uniref:Uncharacterized protein n=1 Tax=Actinoplanes xinjiangensis TaxID=512350 RepID=A0A316FC54_9ACTN|nr:hypothetical protein [Actinoplanes xinjiangensis]PWK43541.1 hypothetical protein BC793_113223 [Actinoplanes xinjiangensis]GIF41858.1 hypothetical protein Axi01nite_61690 [Actinoplanes xinjiangensis]